MEGSRASQPAVKESYLLPQSTAPCVEQAQPGHPGRQRFRSLLPYISGIFLLIIILRRTSEFKTHDCSASWTVGDVLSEVPLIDGHNDLPFALRFLYGNEIYGSFTNETSLPGQVDFPRLRKGRLGGQFWSIYQSCPAPAPDTSISGSDGEFSDELYYENVHDILQQIDLVKRLIVAFPDNLVAAFSSKDVWSNFRSSNRISSLMGVEGLHSIGNSASILRMYHQLGVRYVTLTHFCNNKYADSASQPPLWNGLSEDGKKIVKEMNRIGMAVDLAHTSADTMRQALEISAAPVMFSHASSYAVCPHPRNVPDDVLLQLKKNQGVIMITFVTEYTNCGDPDNATLSDVADHIEHVGNLIGYSHVGIGSDYDGMLTAPKGLEDVSKYPKLFEELASRGLSKQELKGVAGANVLRVLKEVELTSARLVDVKPLEDVVRRPNFSLPITESPIIQQR